MTINGFGYNPEKGEKIESIIIWGNEPIPDLSEAKTRDEALKILGFQPNGSYEIALNLGSGKMIRLRKVKITSLFLRLIGLHFGNVSINKLKDPSKSTRTLSFSHHQNLRNKISLSKETPIPSLRNDISREEALKTLGLDSMGPYRIDIEFPNSDEHAKNIRENSVYCFFVFLKKLKFDRVELKPAENHTTITFAKSSKRAKNGFHLVQDEGETYSCRCIACTNLFFSLNALGQSMFIKKEILELNKELEEGNMLK
jgi:hypothetical protein